MKDTPRTEILDLLAKLIATRSVNPPGGEDRAAAVLIDYLQSAGLKPELEYVQEGRPNVICRLPGSNPDRSLLLTSHMDVVPVGEPDRWRTDPFIATIDDRRVFGRGACDAQASVASMAVAMTRLARAGTVLAGDLLFAGVMGEELGSVGSRHLVANGLRATAAVVGEPTGLDVILGHRGVLHLNVRVHGVSAHASNPDAGVNPSLKMARLLLDLESYVAKVRTRTDPVLGKASLTPTIMATSSGSVATIPDSCTVTFQQELLPSETAQQATDEFRREVERICLARDISATVTSQPRRSPCLIAPDAEIVQIAARAAAKVRSVSPRLAGYTAATDSYVFMDVGMPTVAIGPGNEHGCGVHGINEFVEIDQLLQGVEIYMEIARSFLT